MKGVPDCFVSVTPGRAKGLHAPSCDDIIYVHAMTLLPSGRPATNCCDYHTNIDQGGTNVVVLLLLT